MHHAWLGWQWMPVGEIGQKQPPTALAQHHQSRVHVPFATLMHACFNTNENLTPWPHTHCPGVFFSVFSNFVFEAQNSHKHCPIWRVSAPPVPSCELKGFKFCMHGRNAMLHHAKLGIVPQNTNCEPHAGKLGSRCALLAQHTQFAQDIRLPPTQSRNTTFTEL